MARMHTVKGPDVQRETAVPYYQYVADLLEARYGVRPSRSTLYQYLTRGFPVRRGGPWLKMPVVDDPITKRPQTTEQAMERWLKKLKQVKQKYPAQARS